jgi:hypothetical protein
MTTVKTISGNMEIAKFMGYNIYYVNGDAPCVTLGEEYQGCLISIWAEYHKSWDWLIPIIDKITSMDEYPKFKDYTSSIISEGGIYINTKFIENTWEDVVKFIEWHNLNKTNESS